MLREGDYGAFYQKARERAAGDSPSSLMPLEFTHVMIDEAGQASLMDAVLCGALLCTLLRMHLPSCAWCSATASKAACGGITLVLCMKDLEFGPAYQLAYQHIT